MDLYQNNGYVKLGAYRKVRYMVAVRNHIPCCYVEVPVKLRPLIAGRPDIIDVHGGITFSGEFSNIKGHWLGWDYGREGDYIKGVQSGVKWTEEDLEVHCKAAIIQMEGLL